MSNPLAIGAVTATLRDLLGKGLQAAIPGTTVTTRPPDRARTGTTGNQVNLFLYQTQVNGTLRNSDMPRQIKGGEAGHPPLPLNLSYLITAYGDSDDDLLGHQLLGRAMSILHDHPLLGAEEIRDALAGNDLHLQLERVRITSQPLTVDEMSKLWTTFQTQYRISAFYQVAVVLIESTRPATAPLPVLQRGPGDTGVPAQADLTPPFPALTGLALPNDQPSARLGDTIRFEGHHLSGDRVTLRFRHPLLADPLTLAAQAGGTDTAVSVLLPDTPQSAIAWPAGFYTVAAAIGRGTEPDRTTNELFFGLAPQVTNIQPPQAPAGDVTLTVTCKPRVRPEQRAVLLFGGREVPARPHASPTATLTFDITAAAAGEHFLRLRVDGVDSLLVDRSVTPPRFDNSQKVRIT